MTDAPVVWMLSYLWSYHVISTLTPSPQRPTSIPLSALFSSTLRPFVTIEERREKRRGGGLHGGFVFKKKLKSMMCVVAWLGIYSIGIKGVDFRYAGGRESCNWSLRAQHFRRRPGLHFLWMEIGGSRRHRKKNFTLHLHIPPLVHRWKSPFLVVPIND